MSFDPEQYGLGWLSHKESQHASSLVLSAPALVTADMPDEVEIERRAIETKRFG